MMNSVTETKGGVFSRLSKLYRKKSCGLHPISNLYAEEIDTAWKIHPQPPEPKLITEQDTILKLFDTISALKLAYIQLQEAHIPYQPKKLKAADELIAMQLDSLALLESSFGKPNLFTEIKIQEKFLDELQSQLQCKESEIVELRRDVDEMNRKNAEMEEEAKKMKKDTIFMLDHEWTPTLFADVCKRAYESIHDFTKLLISLMKASNWDLDKAAACIYNRVAYRERKHKKFAFESYMSMTMLDTVPDEWFDLDQFDRVMKVPNAFDALLCDPDSGFGRFCRLKYLVTVKEKMERSFFGNSDQREFVLTYGHPRMPFYQAFVKMARWVWALQVMARSFIPKAEIFYVKGGRDFEEEYMENVVKIVKGCVDVGLTVMPGFKIGTSLIKCRVYASR